MTETALPETLIQCARCRRNVPKAEAVPLFELAQHPGMFEGTLSPLLAGEFLSFYYCKECAASK